MNRSQFGIRTLLSLIALSAFALVVIEFLSKHPDESAFYSLIFAVISAMVGVAMIVLAMLFAVGVLTLDRNAPNQKSKLTECFHMLLFGCFGVGPLILFILVTVFR